jgi:hypothetical protein
LSSEIFFRFRRADSARRFAVRLANSEADPGVTRYATHVLAVPAVAGTARESR